MKHETTWKHEAWKHLKHEHELMMPTMNAGMQWKHEGMKHEA
jgi:hypothetical protein